MTQVTPLQSYLRPRTSRILPLWKLSYLLQLASPVLLLGLAVYSFMTHTPAPNAKFTGEEFLPVVLIPQPLIHFSLLYFTDFTFKLPRLPENKNADEIASLVETYIDPKRGTAFLSTRRQQIEDFALYLADPNRHAGNLFSRTRNTVLGSFYLALFLFTWSMLYALDICVVGGCNIVWKLLMWTEFCLMTFSVLIYAIETPWYLHMGRLARNIRMECMCVHSEKAILGKESLAEIIERLLELFEDENVDRDERRNVIRASIRDDDRQGWGVFGRGEKRVLLV
ncbi:uncharacterized protein LY89DRAFT_789329 [Mollisia scopiformis]|uniref:Uncharacterized protein n=1 Tax=Mollisia scopiformis TaxID=149040 RepID=A0A132B890_MOLSC|nr:uncharacterized protein LY89DRAFT_789329 [Mollisia scopiformis]KUJ08094.1 hypothetical protein LY89DRAFT_789329 [Mollisia scopiformis]